MHKIVRSMFAAALIAALAGCGHHEDPAENTAQAAPAAAAAPVVAPAPEPAPAAIPDSVVRVWHWDQVFIVNADGSVSPRGPIAYNGIQLGGQGVRFGSGVSFGGVDFAAMRGHDMNIHFEHGTLVIDSFM